MKKIESDNGEISIYRDIIFRKRVALGPYIFLYKDIIKIVEKYNNSRIPAKQTYEVLGSIYDVGQEHTYTVYKSITDMLLIGCKSFTKQEVEAFLKKI